MRLNNSPRTRNVKVSKVHDDDLASGARLVGRDLLLYVFSVRPDVFSIRPDIPPGLVARDSLPSTGRRDETHPDPGLT